MKRIYLLMVIMLSFAGSTFAQKDLQLIHFIADTMKYNSQANGGPKTYYINTWGFKNAGTVAIAASDTIYLRTVYNITTTNVIRLNLGSIGGIPVGDTVYYQDTVGWNSGTSFTWCDSSWMKNSSGVISEPIPNNKVCSPVIFKQDPLSIQKMLESANGLALYPNPANNSLKLSYDFAANTDASVVIRDLAGRVVYTEKFGKVSGLKEFTFDISNLTSGMYFVELGTNEAKVVNKVNVQK